MVGKSRGALIDSTGGRAVPKGKIVLLPREGWSIGWKYSRGWKYIHAKCLAQKERKEPLGI